MALARWVDEPLCRTAISVSQSGLIPCQSRLDVGESVQAFGTTPPFVASLQPPPPLLLSLVLHH